MRRSDLIDMQRLNGGQTLVVRDVHEKGIERFVLFGKRGLAIALAEVEKKPRAAEDTAVRAKHVIGSSGARLSLDTEERIVLEAATERVEETILEVAMDASEIVVVGALNVRVEVAAGLRSSFVFVLESDETDQMRSDGDVAAVDQRITVGDELRFKGAAIEDGLAARGVTVGASDGDDVAQRAGTETVTEIREGSSGFGPE